MGLRGPRSGRAANRELGNPDLPEPLDPLDDAVLRAFIADDIPAIREALAIPAYDATPLHGFKTGVCDYCDRAIGAVPVSRGSEGCRNNHEVWATRVRIIAELERRGGFRWADLQHPDEVTARAAWVGLATVSDDLGVEPEAFMRVAARAGWERTGTEQEGNHAGT